VFLDWKKKTGEKRSVRNFGAERERKKREEKAQKGQIMFVLGWGTRGLKICAVAGIKPQASPTFLLMTRKDGHRRGGEKTGIRVGLGSRPASAGRQTAQKTPSSGPRCATMKKPDLGVGEE